MKINFRTRGRGFNVGSTYSIPAVDGLPSYFENFSVSMIYLPGHKWTEQSPEANDSNRPSVDEFWPCGVDRRNPCRIHKYSALSGVEACLYHL